MFLIDLLVTLSTLLAGVPLAPGAIAPSQDVSGSDSFFLGTREMVWTGRVRNDGGHLQESPMSATFAQDLRKELATIQVSIDVEHKLDEALAKLDDLAIRATRRGYEGRKDMLAGVALTRSSVLESLGRPDEARQVVTTVLVRHPTTKKSIFELGPPTEADLADARAAQADARLVARREKLAGAGVASKQADSADKIETIVKDALTRGDDSLARDLGDRAIPTLEKLLLPDLDALPPQQSDELWHYVKISQPRSAEFIQRHFDDGGAIWKARILRAMTNNYALPSGGEWIFSGNSERPRLVVPQWVGVVEKLVDDPSTVRESLRFAGQLARGDALTPSLQRTLARLLRSEDKATVDATMNHVGTANGRPSALPVFEAAMSNSDADVRDAAAKLLAQYARSEALLAAVGDTDPRIRTRVASVLKGHQVTYPIYNSTMSTRSEYYEPVIDEQGRKLLVRLAADPDANVRAEAADAITQLETPLESSVYQKLTSDSDARVRAPLLRSTSIPLADRARIASALASDQDPQVLHAFDKFLFEELFEVNNPVQVEPAFFPAIQIRRHNKVRVWPEGTGQVAKMYAALVKTNEGLKAMAAWATEDANATLAGYVIKQLSESVSNAAKFDGRRLVRPAEARIDLDAPTLARLFEIIHADNFAGGLTDRITTALVALDIDLSALMLPIAKDRSRPLKTRLNALCVAANGPDPQIAPILLELMVDPGWISGVNEKLGADRVASIARALPPQAAATMLNKVLDDPKVSDAMALAVAAGVAKNVTIDARQTDAILSRGLELPWWSEQPNMSAVEGALRQVSKRPRSEQGDWLMRAASHGRYANLAFELIGDLRDPSYLKPLEDFLTDTRWSSAAQLTSTTASVGPLPALNALTRYFDDAAADLILKAAGTTANAALREECFKALATIRKYQEEKGRWNDSRNSREATAASIKDLLGLLDDTNATVRAQAVRGLATLSAVQEMPRIVRMLKDSDAGVRKAAEDALGILNAPPKKD